MKSGGASSIGPIAVGGVGGSGTRVVAKLLREAGVEMGSNTNRADDSLFFTFLFGQPEIRAVTDQEFHRRFAVLVSALSGQQWPSFGSDLVRAILKKEQSDMPGARPLPWRRKQADLLFKADKAGNREPVVGLWGWKAPTTHTVLHRLLEVCPTLKYVHVVRNGLDMAFSNNSRQLRIWGEYLFELDSSDTSPRNMLAYWSRANQRALDIGSTMGDQFLVLTFDELVSDPSLQISKLLDFVGINAGSEQLDRMAEMVKKPRSLGRASEQDLSVFDDRDIAAVRDLGFDTYGA